MTLASSTAASIVGEQALTDFRQGLTGAVAHDLLEQAGGRLLIQLPVGVGKTEWMIHIILHALDAHLYDLVCAFFPRWDILREVLSRLPSALPRVVVSPRPRKRCGDLDAEWLSYEQNGCGILGRRVLCGSCPQRPGCPWPEQYGSALRGAALILATQQHLTLNPMFLHHLRRQSQASDSLVLLDESNLLIRPAEHVLHREDVERFITAQQSVLDEQDQPSERAERWLETSRLASAAPTSDLRSGNWRFPVVDPEWAVNVQQRGRELFGESFCFLGPALHHFAYSDPPSRERLPSGDLRFTTLPSLGERFIIFSGSIAKEVARYRLDPDHARPPLTSPYENYVFEHPGTQWYNLYSVEGAAKFFSGNMTRILDFFAAKIVRNIQEGKRTLLVSRKRFLRVCRAHLRSRLADLGVGTVQIVTGQWRKHNLQDPRTIALINYGVAGVNRFEHVEAAYCLNSYYVNAEAVSSAIYDLEASTERYPIAIRSVGDPPRRRVHLALPDAREPITPQVAQGVLDQRESDVVVQAVGRVRPFTRPREVITFHTGTLPGVRYTRQFRSLAEARAFFGILTASETEQASRQENGRRLRAMGWTVGAIAAELGVSASTVKRDLRRKGGHPAY